jgi:long-subunit acyl-CoA synthetase (AMP-forming)
MFGQVVDSKLKWITFREAADKAEHFSYGLMALNMVPEQDVDGKPMRLLGILAPNRPEGTLTHLACMYQSITTVPL